MLPSRTHSQEKHDFLTYEPKVPYDYIITNPPFQTKNTFIARAIALKKPWLMLMPIDTLVSKGRTDIFRENKMSVWVEPSQMGFTHDGKEVAVAKGMVWIGSGWGERNEMEWLSYGKGTKKEEEESSSESEEEKVEVESA